MRISLIITTLNEAETIGLTLKAIAKQTPQPDEIIIVDGGSNDKTLKKVENWKNRKNVKISKKISIIEKLGNRSAGRNLAIEKAKNNWIAITDAGCIPKPDWLKKLAAKQKSTKASVVAGYYYGLPQNAFEEAVVPYVLVMPNKIDKNNFLPATRSMLLSKKTWEKMGGFDETLDHNEDYAFAKKLQKENVKMTFAQNAQVGWMPRKTLKSFAKMIFRFSFGDTEAGILRPGVLSIFGRYFILWLLLNSKSSITTTLILAYLFWSIWKNKKHVPNGWRWLPILQIISDFAVMGGSLMGGLVLIIVKFSKNLR